MTSERASERTSASPLESLSRTLDQALDLLDDAAVIEGLPQAARVYACSALVSVARVAGVVEALAEGVVVLANREEEETA